MKFGTFSKVMTAALVMALVGACAPKSRFEGKIKKADGPAVPEVAPELPPIGSLNAEDQTKVKALFGGKQPDAVRVAVTEKDVRIALIVTGAEKQVVILSGERNGQKDIELKASEAVAAGTKASGKVTCDNADCTQNTIKIDLNGATAVIKSSQQKLGVIDAATVKTDSKDEAAQKALLLVLENKTAALYHSESGDLGVVQDSYTLSFGKEDVLAVYFRTLVGKDLKPIVGKDGKSISVPSIVDIKTKKDQIALLSATPAEKSDGLTVGQKKISDVDVVTLNLKGEGKVSLVFAEESILDAKTKEVAEAKAPPAPAPVVPAPVVPAPEVPAPVAPAPVAPAPEVPAPAAPAPVAPAPEVPAPAAPAPVAPAPEVPAPAAPAPVVPAPEAPAAPADPVAPVTE